ncbi:MAG: 30S ribosomal protein S12 methylthiotransferase RimO [Prevotellaceae bacterium]|nr:30S ribosomal protein S12 methylthiotransferase RimO [Prevotellaceae bacterium]
MKHNHVDIITLGCSKNLVDSEILMKQFETNGYSCSHDSENPQGEIAIINTCGFIGDAKEESINTILEFAERKKRGELKKLFVMGCLSQRYKEELEKELPEVDKYYGKFDYKQVLVDLGVVESVPQSVSRVITTPQHYAYIKISEGCDRHCAYCAIPIITGKHISRPKEEILSEIKELVGQGVKEFQIIAQELTFYGRDFDGKSHIAELVSDISDIEGVEWIRLHYAYPAQFPFELLDVIREKKNVCKYLDIALQHISDHMLSAMHRHITKEETYKLIEEIRRRVPGITLRTTLMVGFPGETEQDYEELKEFTRWARFERMGAFAYSEEDGTYSEQHYEDDVPEDVKQARLSKLMMIQQKISAELEEKRVGSIMKVIIDRKEGDYYVGRTEFSSPEVDPEVLVPAEEKQLTIGQFYDVKVVGSEEFDLYATTIY